MAYLSILLKENVVLYFSAFPLFLFVSFFPFRFEFFCRDSDRGTLVEKERKRRRKGKRKRRKGNKTKSWYYSVGCTRLPASELNNRSSDGGTGTSL